MGSTEATIHETQTPTVTLVNAEGSDPDPRASQRDPSSGSSSQATSLTSRQCSPVHLQQESYVPPRAAGEGVLG